MRGVFEATALLENVTAAEKASEVMRVQFAHDLLARWDAENAAIVSAIASMRGAMSAL
jgi:hypothetical protein